MRPEPLFPLFADVETLEGIGEKTARLFEKAGLKRVRDLLDHMPASLIDRRLRETVQGAAPGEVATVKAEIGRHINPRRRGAPWRIEARDSQLDFHIIFFQANNEYLARLLPPGQSRIVSGKVDVYDGVLQMQHPDYAVPPDQVDAIPAFEPAHPLFAGIGRKVMLRTIAAALERAPDLPEWLDPTFLQRRGWPTWRDALRTLHQPAGPEDLALGGAARQRLAYDELLAHQLALTLARERMTRRKGRANAAPGSLRAQAVAALPYALTGAQSRALAEIDADMAAGARMLRLLQGDVGAGKTAVALMAMLNAAEVGGQAAMMAPTEILARQHYESIAPLAESLGLTTVLLSGRDKGPARREKLAALAEGEADLILGTHALFQKDVFFKDLRLIVIDEQHRFGVQQRVALSEKGGENADILAMTATPIPRTLALANYGDMDISILDEKPPGRKPIDTRLISLTKYDDIVAGLKRAISEGRRAYWVCPLVEESDKIDVAAAEDRAQALSAALGAEHVALAHGRMPPADKDAAMARFAAGEAKVLVATTVIEVGVDVPEASVVVVEHAERFGLAQLHQLRGRVGRGSAKSDCILLYNPPLGETARARLGVLRETEDGFRIAEEDLRLRGAGDLLGFKQAGAPDFRVADLDAHGELMAIARDDARLIMARDPSLSTPRGEALRLALHLFEREAAIDLLHSP